jgi:DNA-binding transcriptional regulator LsrR (DeoR family)
MDRKTLQIFEAARLCYEMGLSQREVAEDLGVSPATLTRLLQKARELGIVKFSVQPPEEYSRNADALASRLEKTLNLQQAIVVPSSLRPEVVRKELGFATARWISGQLKPRTRIGFSGGRSVAEIIPFLKKVVEGIEVVQLMGGVSPTEIDIQADVIARNAASRLGGTCHVIHGPAIFPSEEELLQLLKNRIVADVVGRFDELDISVVGVGTVTADNPLMQCGFIKDTEIEQLSRSGCVGDICGHFFNGQGQECDARLAKRILGIRLSQLAHIPKVCAVAAGNDKVAGIIAACKSGIPKALVTDTETAEEIVAVLGEGGG